MSRDIEALISKCVEGRAPRDIVRELEEDLPNVSHVRSDVMKALRRAGYDLGNESIKIENGAITVSLPQDVMSESKAQICVILETFGRTYPEIEFLLST